jgi:hypothetical protein
MANISEVDSQPPLDAQSLPSGRSAASPKNNVGAHVSTVDVAASRSWSGGATSTTASASAAASTSLVRRFWQKAKSFRLSQRRPPTASGHFFSQDEGPDAGSIAGASDGMVTRLATIHSLTSIAASTPRNNNHRGPLGDGTDGGSSGPLGYSSQLGNRTGSGTPGFHLNNVLGPAPEFAVGGPPSVAATGGRGYMQVSNLVLGGGFARSGTLSDAPGGLSGALRRLNSSHRHSAHSGGIVPPESIADTALRSEADIAFDITDWLIHRMPAIPVRTQLACPASRRLQPPWNLECWHAVHVGKATIAYLGIVEHHGDQMQHLENIVLERVAKECRMHSYGIPLPGLRCLYRRSLSQSLCSSCTSALPVSCPS